jgi:hypothetical protein
MSQSATSYNAVVADKDYDMTIRLLSMGRSCCWSEYWRSLSVGITCSDLGPRIWDAAEPFSGLIQPKVSETDHNGMDCDWSLCAGMRYSETKYGGSQCSSSFSDAVRILAQVYSKSTADCK